MTDWAKTLPRRIGIGAYTFRVQIVPADHPKLCQTGNGERDCDGFTDTEEMRIYLWDGMSVSRVLNVMQHEVSHAINWVNNVFDGSEEETFVENNTNGLVEVQVRNPRYLTWVVRMVRLFKKEISSE